MNQKNFNNNITGTQKEDAPKSIMQQDSNKFLSYMFEIMDDENIYSSLFNGNLTDEETRKMLESIQNCLYEKIPDAIQMYLDQNNLAYSGFVSTKKPLEHSKVMELAGSLLYPGSNSSLDSYFRNADTCYVIADHQKWISENCCQGCYFAVK